MRNTATYKSLVEAYLLHHGLNEHLTPPPHLHLFAYRELLHSLSTEVHVSLTSLRAIQQHRATYGYHSEVVSTESSLVDSLRFLSKEIHATSEKKLPTHILEKYPERVTKLVSVAGRAHEAVTLIKGIVQRYNNSAVSPTRV